MPNRDLVFRARTFGELLDQAFRVYRRNFALFVGMVLPVQIPLGLLQIFPSTAWANFVASSSETTGSSFFVALVAAVLYNFLAQLMNAVCGAALTKAVTSDYLGELTSLGAAYRSVLPRLLPLVVVNAVLFFASTALYFWLFVPCFGWFSGFGALLAVNAMIQPLITPVMVNENFGVFASLARTWFLVRRRFWWMCGLAITMWLVSIFLVSGPASVLNLILLGITNAPSFPAELKTMIESSVQALVNVFSSVLYLPLQVTVFALVYFDLRIRTEALDMHLQIPPTEGLLASSATIQAEKPLVLSDLGYITLTSIVSVLGLCLVMMACYIMLIWIGLYAES